MSVGTGPQCSLPPTGWLSHSVPPPADTGGNRALNSVLHVIAVCQIRDGGRGQEYYQRKIAEGKTPSEARRALKRRLSNVVYRIMKRDQRNHLAQAA
ncbi:hypothetical protein [Streptomyces purpureus]|uniref:Transposase n=1 Tax=Streptomyces purpureus TaxID=1951 RepID=A0A918HGC2_9ACTN|nr:hypothetical protein [Streptomyces purpureus]GGT56356.1 hypothetical protein GCM10014713_57560 [Streptomyces purpureus]